MEFKQELPPPGGYPSITYKYIPLKSRNGAYIGLSAVVGFTIMGFYFYRRFRFQDTLERIENRCGNVALAPMITAERDRLLLKQLKRNRDVEEELMKDVKGWEVGKFEGERVFLTVGPDDYVQPGYQEYYAHTDQKYQNFATQNLSNTLR